VTASAWRPLRRPDVTSPDGTPITVFEAGDGPPLVLVHGATADHTTFRVIGPLLEPSFHVFAMDRRGRGGSGDGSTYDVQREFEDVAAVAEEAAAAAGLEVVVFGHSFGGRCALGAALGSDAIGRVICYEGAPAPPGQTYHPGGVDDRLADALAQGDRDGALTLFMREVVGMSEEDLARYRADPVWPARAAAAHTLLRELDVETSPAASLDALGGVRQPVVQILGGASLPAFHEATWALDRRLGDGSVVVIEGARHAAHHTHPDEVVAVIRAATDRHATPLDMRD
jgi:pimeloyl-ACP methyl ester carboxylesterase